MTLRRRPGTPTRESPSESEKAWAISIRFSNWSPLASQAGRKQLFAERCALVCNWFDAWNEEERCSFTCGLLSHCSPAQLRWAREWLVANVPPERADFSTLLPRALSLRILGFLSPRDLSRAAQDVIWALKCVNQGWFLPYSPCETEFGAWKRHYIQCVTSLDWTHPPQDQTQNRENPQRVKSAASAKQRARATRRWLKRQSTTLKRQQEDIICSRSAIVPCHALAILDGALRCPSDVSREVNQRQLGGSTELMDTVRATRRKLAHSPCMCKAVGCPALPTTQGLPETIQAGLSCCRPAEQTLLVLISSAVPAPELLLAAVKTRVKSLLYDYRVDSLDCLLRRVEATLGNQEASGIAVITDGDAGEIRLLSCVTVSAKNLQVPEVRDFWERLSGCLCLGEYGGHLDIFHPLKSSEGGVQLMGQLEEVFESRVTSPASALPFTFWQDDCEWSWTPPDGSDVPSLYFSRDHLITWGRVSDSMAEATKASRQHLQPFLAQLGREVLDRAVGQLLFENLSVVQVMTYQEAGLAVAEAFFALAQKKSMACPVEFLARFLHRRCEWKGCQHVGERKDLPERETKRSANSQPQNSATTSQAGPQQHAVGHEVMAAEIMRRETVYMRTLESLKEVYASPLKAALASGRPIISATNVQVIVSDPLHILDLHRDLCRGLQMKMVEGGPEHSLGEVFSRFMKKLSVYTSFFNNYSHVLQTIEECRDDSPAFRAFLKSRDYSPSTRMLSLPELLLEVARRLPCLLYELRSLHLSTSFDNSDRVQIAAAADSLQNYCNFIKTVKGRIQREALLCEVQQTIVACPKLQERHRFFICQQDVANLRRHANDPRIYEHFQDLGLFLFNDALVFTTCSVTHSPFERSRKTRHHFYVSVSLACLHLDDISDSKYVCNAFRLCGTRQEWTCAVDTSEEKLTWLAALNAAIRSANWT